jgi:hypothetical protein
MKRAVMAVAVLGLVVGMGFAASNEVSSVNIVGYNVDMVPGSNNFNLVAVQFTAFDPSLQGVFGTNQLEAGIFPQLADKVYLFVNGGYEAYAPKPPSGLFYSTGDWGGMPTNPPIGAGTAMWLQSKQGTGPQKTVTLAGEAVKQSIVTNMMDTGYQLLGYPYSCERALNDMALKDQGTGGIFPQLADRLYVWNGMGYDAYALKSGATPAWYSTADWGGTPTTDVVPLGRGFWYEARGDFTWVENNPYLGAFGN